MLVEIPSIWQPPRERCEAAFARGGGDWSSGIRWAFLAVDFKEPYLIKRFCLKLHI